MDDDEVADSDNGGDLERIGAIETGDEDACEVIIGGIGDEKRLVHHELEKGCGCPEDCYSCFSED